MSDCYIKMDKVNMLYPSTVYNAMSIKETFFSLLKLEKKKKLLKDVHALRDFTFHVKKGERVGVIGSNGSGKSTLLRTIAGIYPIESGKIEIEGDIRSLFEISLGFDMESSGRENVLYRGLLIGATPSEISAKTQEIIDFADIGEYIDYPVKTYSSGMLVRLAFAISTSVEGQILLLDEVVGAGDVSFMEKAKKRIFALMDKADILVFVSHDMETIRQVCDRVILMKKGIIVKDGKPDEVIKMYLNGEY